MCGIAGMAGFCDEALLGRMVASLRHRGPDDDGFYTSAPRVAFGMRRLSIIDLAGGKQPMFNEDGRIALVFNGEIYNFKELRAELEAKGHKFKTDSDTETIVHLYEEDGVDCPKRLRGMFAFAIWDENKQLLFLARDHLGVKPLYYAPLGNRLIFASELKGLLADGELPRQINFKAIDLFLTYLYIPSPLTIFENVFKLEPGCSLMWKNGVVEQRRYWSVPINIPPLSPPYKRGEIEEDEICEKIKSLLSEFVKEQLVSDVPLGLFLSGGLDSSTITAMAKQFVSQPLKVFTVAYSPPDTDYNEVSKAEEIAKRFGCEHRICVLEPEVEQLATQIVRAFDEPFADSSAVPTFLISREARKNVTVALTGIGGDEVFAGYPRYIGARLSRYLDVLPVPVRKLLARVSAVLPEHGGSVDWPGRIKRFLRGGEFSFEKRYQAWVSACSDSMKKELYSDDFKAGLIKDEIASCNPPKSPFIKGGLRGITARNDGQMDINTVTAVDLAGYLPEDLLTMADRMSMANSLELRVPMCDVRLVEFMSGLPLSLKTRNFKMKYLLKKAMSGALPETIIGQKKMGFMMPLARWVREELNELIDDCLSEERISKRGYFNPEFVRWMINQHRTGKKNYADQIWALLVLELWHREYVDREIEAQRHKEPKTENRGPKTDGQTPIANVGLRTSVLGPLNSQSISLPARSRILLLNIAGIGDFVETIPAMEAIRQHYPEAHITMLVSAKAMGFAEDCPYVDNVISVVTRSATVLVGRSIWNLAKLTWLALGLRKNKYDVIINFHQFGTQKGAKHMSSFIKMIGARHIVGRNTNGWGYIYTNSIVEHISDKKDVHAYGVEIAKLIGCDKVPCVPKLWINDSDRIARDKLFQRHDITKNTILIGLHPGGERPTRHYFPEKYAQVADRLLETNRVKIVIFGGKNDIDDAAAIVRHMRGNAINLVGQTNLKIMAAAFERLALLICAHSSAMHIGGAVGIPVIAIVGSGDPVRYKPAGDSSQIKLLWEPVGCNPCYNWICPEEDSMKCMKRIELADIISAAQELLHNRGYNDKMPNLSF